mgnify:CR=1 FL=1
MSIWIVSGPAGMSTSTWFSTETQDISLRDRLIYMILKSNDTEDKLKQEIVVDAFTQTWKPLLNGQMSKSQEYLLYS